MNEEYKEKYRNAIRKTMNVIPKSSYKSHPTDIRASIKPEFIGFFKSRENSGTIDN